MNAMYDKYDTNVMLVSVLISELHPHTAFADVLQRLAAFSGESTSLLDNSAQLLWRAAENCGGLRGFEISAKHANAARGND